MNFNKAKDMSGNKRKTALVYNSLIIFFACVFLVCIFMLASYYIQEWRNESQNDEIAQEVVIPTVEDEQSEENVSSVVQEGFKFAPIPKSIDFTKLVAKNEDVTAWIFNQNGVINYPVLKGEDNSYYLNHTVNKKKNVNGSIFMDYRNDGSFNDKVTMIYGHNMKNGTMFATIRRYRTKAYYEAYPSFYLYTPNGNYRLDVFSSYQTTVSDPVFTTDFNTEDTSELISHAFSKSIIKADVSVDKTDRIVILSTCTGKQDDARFVVLCKLVSVE
ncbi:MAG: class B sortase [Acutalibacteraceae bacterium]|nr:class B sortase [Acutalibacteraceae bacterium]